MIMTSAVFKQRATKNYCLQDVSFAHFIEKNIAYQDILSPAFKNNIFLVFQTRQAVLSGVWGFSSPFKKKRKIQKQHICRTSQYKKMHGRNTIIAGTHIHRSEKENSNYLLYLWYDLQRMLGTALTTERSANPLPLFLISTSLKRRNLTCCCLLDAEIQNSSGKGLNSSSLGQMSRMSLLHPTLRQFVVLFLLSELDGKP